HNDAGDQHANLFAGGFVVCRTACGPTVRPGAEVIGPAGHPVVVGRSARGCRESRRLAAAEDCLAPAGAGTDPGRPGARQAGAARPPVAVETHETVSVDGKYTRQLISYGVEADERAHAYLAIPEGLEGPTPAIVVLHGTYKDANLGVAGLVPGYELPLMDDLAR